MAPKPLGYNVLNLGLSNQKIALLGLFVKAMNQKRSICLPAIANYDPNRNDHSVCAFEKIFDRDLLQTFANAFGVGIVAEIDCFETNGWDCFIEGTEAISRSIAEQKTKTFDTASAYFRCLRPLISKTELFHRLRQCLYEERSVQVACQLRIEKDWLEQGKKAKDIAEASSAEYEISFDEILRLVAIQFGQNRAIYALSNEADLIHTKDYMRDVVYNKHKLRLIWKSDLILSSEYKGLSIIDQTLLDFELALVAGSFVGTSRSTFTNLIAFEGYSRGEDRHGKDFLYNLMGGSLKCRHDAGMSANPVVATTANVTRERLVAEDDNDVEWPLKLTTHVANHGDFQAAYSILDQTRHQAIACNTMLSELFRIEAFSIESFLETVRVEFRGRSVTGEWTSWAESGQTVGTRGMYQPLTGYAVRLVGPLSLYFTCITAARFQDCECLVQCRDGDECTTQPPANLKSMQIIFRRRPPDKILLGQEVSHSDDPS